MWIVPYECSHILALYFYRLFMPKHKPQKAARRQAGSQRQSIRTTQSHTNALTTHTDMPRAHTDRFLYLSLPLSRFALSLCLFTSPLPLPRETETPNTKQETCMNTQRGQSKTGFRIYREKNI